MHLRLLFAVAVLSLVAPAVAAGQGARPGVFIQGAFGFHWIDRGDHQSLSVGVSFGDHERFRLLVSAERSDRPTRVTFYPDGYAATRGATATFVSGAFEYSPITFKRLSPYIVAGMGFGTSRQHVDEIFPNGATHHVILQFPGFGSRVRLTDHLSAFGDWRAMFQHRRGEPDAGIFGIIRGGLAWRF